MNDVARSRACDTHAARSLTIIIFPQHVRECPLSIDHHIPTTASEDYSWFFSILYFWFKQFFNIVFLIIYFDIRLSDFYLISVWHFKLLNFCCPIIGYSVLWLSIPIIDYLISIQSLPSIWNCLFFIALLLSARFSGFLIWYSTI